MRVLLNFWDQDGEGAGRVALVPRRNGYCPLILKKKLQALKGGVVPLSRYPGLMSYPKDRLAGLALSSGTGLFCHTSHQSSTALLGVKYLPGSRVLSGPSGRWLVGGPGERAPC